MAVHADDPPSAGHAAKVTDSDRVLDLSKLSIPVDVSGVKSADGQTFAVGHATDDAWAAKVSASNPRSPAAEYGTVVVGCGGGAQVYGYDAETGIRIWTASSKDAGISNIVASGGYAYYTTFSCTLERVEIASGKHSYSQYLAPTVSCAPAVQDDVVASAYSSGGAWNVSLHGAARGGKRWTRRVGTQGVLTAPVIMDEKVYVACADGKVTSLDSHKGSNDWTADLGAVSAPVATPWGLLVTTVWDGKGSAGVSDAKPMTAAERKRLERESVSGDAPLPGTLVAAKDRRIALLDNLDEKPEGKSAGQVAGPRASLDFQGLRPGISGRYVIFAYAGQVVCIDPRVGKAVWRVKVADDKADFVRPVCHEGLVFVATNSGAVCALEESTGALIWSYEFKGQQFLAEPAVSENRLFLTSGSGLLVAMPIGIYDIDMSNPAVGADGVEGAADTYWKVQKAFRTVRNLVRGIQTPEDATPQGPNPAADNGNTPDNGAPDNGEGNRDATPNREEEELTKGQWERREDRRAERAKAEGKRYEKKPYKRE